MSNLIPENYKFHLLMKTFYDNKDFGWVPELESNKSMILAELEAILHEPATFQPSENWLAAHPKMVESNENREISWKTFEFVFFGIKQVPHIKKCPQTFEILSTIPELVTAQFSVLLPHTHVKPHKGYSTMVLRSHLPLIIPDEKKCALKIENDTHHWKEGELVIFDDSLTHEAWNNTDKLRAVLMFDFAKPGGYTSEEICRYKIENADDPFLLNIAPKTSWIEWLDKGEFPYEEPK